MLKFQDEEEKRRYELRRADPQAYLDLVTAEIEQDPQNPAGYFERYSLWTDFRRYDLALQDIERALALDGNMAHVFSRAQVLRLLERYEEAIAEYTRAFALDHDHWLGGFGYVCRAECHALLGNEEAALADWAAIEEDYWLPGFLGLPGGTKAQIGETLRRQIAAARAAKGD